MEVQHNGVWYRADDGSSEPTAQYQDDALTTLPNSSSRVLVYRMRLEGAHDGPAIDVLMVNPRDEPDDEGGRDLVWDTLVWADDKSPFTEDWLLDTYTDALRAELRECARNWS